MHKVMVVKAAVSSDDGAAAFLLREIPWSKYRFVSFFGATKGHET